MLKQGYIPAELPIVLKPDEHIKLLNQIIHTTKALERIRSEFKYSPARRDIISLFSLIESVQSTKIEGTKTTFDEFVESEINKKNNSALQETTNYKRAMEHGYIAVKNTGEINLNLIKDIHKIVLKDARGEKKQPGEFRKTANWIGSNSNPKDISYIPPEAEHVPRLMQNLENFINKNDFQPLIAAAIIHAQFESIHPFKDGNGRVGRILIALYFMKHRVCGDEAIFISDELEKNKFKYYALLNATREDEPKWFDWISFFIDSVENQAKKYESKVDKINNIIDDCYKDEKISQNGIAKNLIIALAAFPITNSSRLSALCGLSLTTVNKWLKYFVEKKILYPDGKQRNTTYRFYEVLDVIR